MSAMAPAAARPTLTAAAGCRAGARLLTVTREMVFSLYAPSHAVLPGKGRCVGHRPGTSPENIETTRRIRHAKKPHEHCIAQRSCGRRNSTAGIPEERERGTRRQGASLSPAPPAYLTMPTSSTSKIRSLFGGITPTPREPYAVAAGHVSLAFSPTFIVATPCVQHGITRASGNSAGPPCLAELSNSVPFVSVPR